MTREEVVAKTKEKAEVEIKELRNELRKLIKNWTSGNVSSTTEITVADDIDEEGTLWGTIIAENITITEKYNYLYGLEVKRRTYISSDDPEDLSCDDIVAVSLYWNDCSDHLDYQEDYYPNKSNEAIIEVTKSLLAAADMIMKNAWPKR